MERMLVMSINRSAPENFYYDNAEKTNKNFNTLIGVVKNSQSIVPNLSQLFGQQNISPQPQQSAVGSVTEIPPPPPPLPPPRLPRLSKSPVTRLLTINTIV